MDYFLKFIVGIFIALAVIIIFTGAYYFIYVAGGDDLQVPPASWTPPQTLPPEPLGLIVPTDFNGPTGTPQ